MCTEQAGATQVLTAEEPFRHLADQYRWNPEIFERVIRDYNIRDIAI